MELLGYFTGILLLFCVLHYIGIHKDNKIIKIAVICFLFSLVATLFFLLDGKDWSDSWYFKFSDFLELYLFNSYLVLVGIGAFYKLDSLVVLKRNIILFAIIYLIIVSIIQIFGVMIFGEMPGGS